MFPVVSICLWQCFAPENAREHLSEEVSEQTSVNIELSVSFFEGENVIMFGHGSENQGHQIVEGLRLGVGGYDEAAVAR